VAKTATLGGGFGFENLRLSGNQKLNPQILKGLEEVKDISGLLYSIPANHPRLARFRVREAEEVLN
jgi:hypothetical protein